MSLQVDRVDCRHAPKRLPESLLARDADGQRLELEHAAERRVAANLAIRSPSHLLGDHGHLLRPGQLEAELGDRAFQRLPILLNLNNQAPEKLTVAAFPGVAPRRPPREQASKSEAARWSARSVSRRRSDAVLMLHLLFHARLV